MKTCLLCFEIELGVKMNLFFFLPLKVVFEGKWSVFSERECNRISPTNA